MYVAAKGGERAITEAHRQLAEQRRGDPSVPEVSPAQISEQLGRAVDRVMMEGGLFDRELAALAIKQAQGDLVEAIFLVRAYRNTLPRFGYTNALDGNRMIANRRISSAFKDIPGGQILGPTTDYSLRLLDGTLARIGADDVSPPPGSDTEERSQTDQASVPNGAEPLPRVLSLLADEGLMEPAEPATGAPVCDVTRDPVRYPATRDARLQSLARGDEGFLLALAYSTQRGYGATHPFAGEFRQGTVVVSFTPPELGFAIDIGELAVTECTMINQFCGNRGNPTFTRGYGLTVGNNERKAIATALLDRALRSRELGEEATAPAQNQEFVLSHADNVEASGFVQHLKLPHYVDFQAELDLLRSLRRGTETDSNAADRSDADERIRPS